jgi:hypothetical protein
MIGTIKNIQVTQGGNVSFEDLLKSVSTLESSEIIQFMQEMGRIVAARKVKSLSERETELLKAINESIPTKLQVSYESLMLKLNNESISDDEHKDLLKLVAKMEAKKGKKVEYMMELAQLRKISLKELVQQLNANSFFYA